MLNHQAPAKEGVAMFIHFDADKSAQCDSCGTHGTIMHMSVMRMNQTLSLCVACFGTLTQALSHASQKLRQPVARAELNCRDKEFQSATKGA
jgi:hypothetical protein